LTTRHTNGEVSYTTIGSVFLRGSVLKEAESVEGDYGQHEQEAGGMTMGDLERVPCEGRRRGSRN